MLCIDPAQAMVAHRRAHGLNALQTDVLNLVVSPPADSVFAMNSLLHVPAARFPEALLRTRGALRPGGLCYIGMYGGADHEGPFEHDHYVPPRWFVSHSDDRLLELARQTFDVVDFHTVDIGDDGYHFQSLTLLHAG